MVKKEKGLTIQKFNLWFSDSHILKDVSFSIPENKVTAIIGPSGCGKSTLLRSINRMNDLIPEAKIKGKILIDNENIYRENIDLNNLRMKVGMVFQKPNPFPKSIYDNVAYGLKIKGIRNKNKVDSIVEKSLKDAWLWKEVKDRLDESAMELSGGQQQRLCIARALATNPEILLLDEPTSALDPKSTKKIEELVLELKDNVTVLQVTHNISQAARISDYTAFLYLGELIEYGKTDKIFTVPEDQRTEDYLEGKFG
ncbi:MAG: phosphate ABC transporter ATP-binding protein [Candidatus Mcinerneyibacterium aminivorans]|uniref:Phosphate ABC transporter ATP-binding protein n=1 Tax=Candidatus Mcinerneyibacterium aminivorans TaxID=2703815 RepID=A0A5D0MES6_9BACT|nr:MAG: phosphate ABC transporter ATP-binding protein [Candidatus Mcinerneyibacterium aminivorans]